VAEARRTRWPDERIDDLAMSVREEIRDLRAEMRQGFGELRTEMNDGFREVRGEASLNRRLLMNLWATTLLGFVGLLVEISLR
jgi:hypothetical protein